MGFSSVEAGLGWWWGCQLWYGCPGPVLARAPRFFARPTELSVSLQLPLPQKACSPEGSRWLWPLWKATFESNSLFPFFSFLSTSKISLPALSRRVSQWGWWKGLLLNLTTPVGSPAGLPPSVHSFRSELDGGVRGRQLEATGPVEINELVPCSRSVPPGFLHSFSLVHS